MSPKKKKATEKKAPSKKTKLEDHEMHEFLKEHLGDEIDLPSIYKEATGVDMTTIEHGSRWKRTVIIVLLFLLSLFVSLSIISFVIFQREPAFSGNNVDLNIQARETAQSGEKFTYTVVFQNREKVPFRNAELLIRYPKGFIFESATPAPIDDFNTKWSFGSIAEGETQEIEIHGQLIGAEDDEKTITATMNYLPANFSSEFTEVASKKTVIAGSIVHVNVTGPEQILVGERAEYVIALSNKTEESFDDAKLVIYLPDEFTLDTITPDIDRDNLEQNISIGGQEEAEYVLSGFFTTDAQGELTLAAEIQTIDGSTTYTQSRAEAVSRVIKGDLALNLIENGTYRDNYLDFAQPIQYSLTYENVSSHVLSDVSISLILETRNSNTVQDSEPIVDVNDISSVYDYTKDEVARDGVINTQKLTWTSKTIDDLEELQPGDKGTIELQVPMLASSTIQDIYGFAHGFALRSIIEATIAKIGDIDSSVVVQSSPILSRINSDTALSVAGRYYDAEGIALGSGPLPAQVGQQTTFVIDWVIDNSVHELKDITLSATLPEDASWIGKDDVQAGELSYDKDTNSITWRVNKMPVAIDELRARFKIGFLPRAEHAGTIVLLVNRTSMSAEDTVSGGEIILSAPAVTTGSLDDEFAADKGAVEGTNPNEEVLFDNAGAGGIRDIFSEG